MERYNNLNLNYIDGKWRAGNSDKKIVVSNPYNGEEVAVFKQQRWRI